MQRRRLIQLLAGVRVPSPAFRPAGGAAPRACIDCGESAGPGRPGRRCPTCRDLYSNDELRIRANRMGITCRQANDLLQAMTSGAVLLRQEPGASTAERARFRTHCVEMATDGVECTVLPVVCTDEDVVLREYVLVGREVRGEFREYANGLLTFRCIPKGADNGKRDE